MKRGIIFVCLLTRLTVSGIATEFYYTKNFKKQADEILEKCMGGEFFANIEKAEKLICEKKHINTLFYPKDFIRKISMSIKQAVVLYQGGDRAGALAQLESVRILVRDIC